jgi:ribose transport system permease protein
MAESIAQTTNGQAERRDVGGQVATVVSRLALLFILILLCVVFSALKPETFGTFDNFKSIASNEVTIAFIAFGATLPLIVGEFDLSLAAVFTWAQIILVGLVVQHGWTTPLALVIAGLSGLAVGLINGIAVVRFQISSFIATLATGSLMTGAVLAYSKGESIFGKAPHGLTNFTRNQIADIDLPVYYLVVAAIVLAVILGRMPVGRRMYATGGNQRAAQLTGIATQRYVIATFVAASLMATIGGVILGSRVGAASSDVGNTLLIPAFAGAFLGTTAFQPGRFNIPGTLVAVYVVGVAVTGLEQLGAALWVEPVFQGAVLFIAVGLSAYTARFRAQRARLARLRELEERRAHERTLTTPPATGAPAGA